jgi:3,4-dihydroxy 2-butanone 4-phosphate synthase/GTP cyclohydrolase II
MPLYDNWLQQASQHRQETGRPLVGLCFAQSLDGRLTVERGRPTALSGPQSSRLTHRLRAAHDAILVGVGTVIADDPQLSVRHVQGRNPQPVVLDSRLRMPLESRLLQRANLPVWIATTPAAEPEKRAALQGAGARLLLLPADSQGRVSLTALLSVLAENGVNSLMVEGGAQVITAFLSQGLADWVAVTIAPVFLGGLSAIEGSLSAPPRLKEPQFEQLGEDILIFGRLR